MGVFGLAMMLAVQAAGEPPRSAPVALVPSAAEAALLRAEDERFRAEVAHDAGVLDRMTAPEVSYSHMNGMVEDKASVMRSFTRLPFTAIEPASRRARVLGDTGVVRGLVTRHLGERVLNDAYLAVYVRRGGTWQLIDWVSYAPPQAPGARPAGGPPPGMGAPPPR